MRKPQKCELCREREAVYAMQYISDIVPSLYTLGSHIRGFKITRVCAECGAEQKYVAEQAKQFITLAMSPPNINFIVTTVPVELAVNNVDVAAAADEP